MTHRTVRCPVLTPNGRPLLCWEMPSANPDTWTQYAAEKEVPARLPEGSEVEVTVYDEPLLCVYRDGILQAV